MSSDQYPPASELVHRLRRALLDGEGRKVTFIIGSGASKGAVPDADEMVTYFRKSLGTDDEDLEDFDALLSSTPRSKKYQVAADFVINRAGASKVNRAIRLAVLKARTPAISAETFMSKSTDEKWMAELNKQYKNWVVPQGIMALGQILALVPNDVRGPILTTNFDPLIEVSLRSAGLTPWGISADSEGSIHLPPVDELNIVPVVHVHGIWSEGDTLHSPLQLAQHRPQLASSIRQAIAGTTCCIIGYSGWDDILTRSIESMLVGGPDYDVDILWASYGQQPTMGVLENKKLPGHLQPYVAVDSNRLLPEIKAAMNKRLKVAGTGIVNNQVAISISENLRTISLINDKFIAVEKMRHLDSNLAISYFDGRQPNWVDVLNIGIPELSWISDVKYLLTDMKTQLHMMIEAPVGEGKSTGLMQLAKWVALETQDTAYFASSAGLDASEVLALPVHAGRSLVFIDEADLRVNQIDNIMRELDAAGRSDLKLVLAARDTDWFRACQSSRIVFSEKRLRKQFIQGLTPADATQIVRTWNKYGLDAVGRLRDYDNEVEQSQVLYSESVDAGGAALLGALLFARYGDGFRDHILSLMRKLSRVEIREGYSLLRVYASICLFSTTENADPLTLSQVSIITGLTHREVDALIVTRLGREAATQKHGEFISARHKRIAQTVLSLLENFGLSVPLIMRDAIVPIVRNAIGGSWDAHVLNVAYISQKVEDKALAIEAAKAAVDADPSQLRLRSAYIGILRKFDQLSEAGTVCLAAWKDLESFSDAKLTFRKFLLEWSRVEGRLGRTRDSLALNAAALLDWPSIDELTADSAARGLSGMAFCFGHISIKDEEMRTLWQGVLAEEATSMGSNREVQSQAAAYLEQAEAVGYVAVVDDAKRRELLKGAIRNAVYSSSLSVANRSRPFVGNCGQLLALTHLHQP